MYLEAPFHLYSDAYNMLESTSPKIAQALMTTLAQVAKANLPRFYRPPVPQHFIFIFNLLIDPKLYWFLCPKNPHCLMIAEEGGGIDLRGFAAGKTR